MAHSSTFRGGDGGGTSYNFGWGGDGGHGVSSGSGCAAVLRGCDLFAGGGGWGSGCSFCGGGKDGSSSSGASITILLGDPRELCLFGQLGALREGATAAVSIDGYPGSLASMIYAFGTDRREFGPGDHLLLLSTPFIRLLPSPAPRPIPLALPSRNSLGSFSSGGTLNVTFQASALPSGVESERVLAQPLHVPTSGGWSLGAPLALFVVDSSL